MFCGKDKESVPGVDENMDAVYGELALATQGNHVDKVRKILDAHPQIDLNTPLPSHELGEQPALHTAVANGYEEMATLLLERGADPNGRSRVAEPWYPPIHALGMSGDVPCLLTLIAHGADLDGRDSHGITPFPAFDHHDLHMLNVLMNLGAPPDEPGSGGFTQLHQACIHRSEESARFLLEAGADPLRKNAEGKPPLHYITTNGPGSLCEALVAHYASLPRFDAAEEHDFAAAMEADAQGFRMVDNPRNWQEGLAEQVMAWQRESPSPLFSREQLFAPGPEEGPSIATILVQTRKADVLFTLLEAARSPVRDEDMLQGNAMTPLAEAICHKGQLPSLFQPIVHAGSLSRDVCHHLLREMPVEQQHLLPRHQTMHRLNMREQSHQQGRA